MAVQQQTRGDTPKTMEETSEHQSGTAAKAADTGMNEAKPASKKQSHHHLVIRVSEGGKSPVNIRIPLGLARAAGKFIPPKEKENLKAQGIDIDELLEELTGDELGPLVQVEEDSKSVWISVE